VRSIEQVFDLTVRAKKRVADVPILTLDRPTFDDVWLLMEVQMTAA
jgi:hypothetical protein